MSCVQEVAWENSGSAISLVVSAPTGVSVVSIPAKPAVLVGRARGCDVTIADPSVAEVHVRLHLEGEIAIEDLGSGAFTAVSGARIASGRHIALTEEMVVSIGQTRIMLRVQDGVRCTSGDRTSDVPTARIRDQMFACEGDAIRAALAATGGNQTKAARLLGLSRRTLTNKLNLHGLPRPRKKITHPPSSPRAVSSG